MSELMNSVMGLVGPFLQVVGQHEGTVGILLGTCLGYVLSARASERHFRRTLVRDIALEYRRLARPRKASQLPGLILAGICQCKNNREYAAVLELVDDLAPNVNTDALGKSAGDDWRPRNGNYVKFFKLLKAEGASPTNGSQVRELKRRVETRFLRWHFRSTHAPKMAPKVHAQTSTSAV